MQELELTLDRDTGQNGDKLHLTIKVLQMDPSFYELYYVVSQLGSATQVWPGIVAN